MVEHYIFDLAAKTLEKQGIHSQVISMHSIRPFDKHLFIKTAQECGAIVIVEEHSILGIPDEYTITGPQSDIFAHYGISEEGLYKVGINY